MSELSPAILETMNVAEKKATRETHTKLMQLANDFRTKCESPAFEVVVDWAAYPALRDYAKACDKTPDNMIEHAEVYFSNTVYHLNRLVDDADYRAELAKINTFHLKPSKIDAGSVWENVKITKLGTTLTATFDACKTPGNFDWGTAIKELF